MLGCVKNIEDRRVVNYDWRNGVDGDGSVNLWSLVELAKRGIGRGHGSSSHFGESVQS